MVFKVCPDVIREVRVLRDRETGEEQPIELEAHFQSGALSLIQPETESEFELLIDYSALLGSGDGEAMCFALAECRGLTIAIDDERAIKCFVTLATATLGPERKLDLFLRWQPFDFRVIEIEVRG